MLGKLIKGGMTLFTVIAISTLITELMLCYVYWSHGTLTQSSLRDIKAILEGRDPAEIAGVEEELEEEEQVVPSQEEVSRNRVTRIVELQSQLVALKEINDMLKKESETIEAEKQQLNDQKDQFDKMIADLAARNDSEAAEKTRAILQSLKPDEQKVAYLMNFATTDCVTLLNKMDPQEISKILKSFSDSNREEYNKRGQEILQQIYQGGALGQELEKYTQKPGKSTQIK